MPSLSTTPTDPHPLIRLLDEGAAAPLHGGESVSIFDKASSNVESFEASFTEWVNKGHIPLQEGERIRNEYEKGTITITACLDEARRLWIDLPNKPLKESTDIAVAHQGSTSEVSGGAPADATQVTDVSKSVNARAIVEERDPEASSTAMDIDEMTPGTRTTSTADDELRRHAAFAAEKHRVLELAQKELAKEKEQTLRQAAKLLRQRIAEAEKKKHADAIELARKEMDADPEYRAIQEELALLRQQTVDNGWTETASTGQDHFSFGVASHRNKSASSIPLSNVHSFQSQSAPPQPFFVDAPRLIEDNPFLETQKTSINKTWADSVGLSSSSLTVPLYRTNGAAAGKLLCEDYKDGLDGRTWLAGFDRACQNAGLEPSRRQHPLEMKLPTKYKVATRINNLTCQKMNPTDYQTIRASVLAVICGASGEDLASKRNVEFMEMRTWTPNEPLETYLLELIGRFHQWMDAEGLSDDDIRVHEGSTLLKKLRDSLPPALKPSINRRRGVTYADVRTTLLAAYRDECEKGTPGVAPGAKSQGIRQSIHAPQQFRSNATQATAKRKPRESGPCKFGERCQQRDTCSRNHPSDTCPIHPQSTHSISNCWGAKKGKPQGDTPKPMEA